MILKLLYEKEMKLVDETQKNQQFNLKMRHYKFVAPEHLELNSEEVSHEKLNAAQNELEKLPKVKLPQDKLVCIVNACKIIGGLITFGNENQGYGADDFLPALIFCLLHSELKDVFSEISFVKLFKKSVWRSKYN